MEPKFQKGDLVGFRSDSDFTKSNRDKPAQKITLIKQTKYGYEYEISNYAGTHLEHELESRQNNQ